jgi:hypothetical protein
MRRNARLAARTEKEINLVAEEIVNNGGTALVAHHVSRSFESAPIR